MEAKNKVWSNYILEDKDALKERDMSRIGLNNTIGLDVMIGLNIEISYRAWSSPMN